MSFTIEVESADEGTLLEELNLSHENCTGGAVDSKEIEATIGKKYKNPKPKRLLELECNSCHQKVWIPIRSGGTAEIINAAVDGRERTVLVYRGRIMRAEFRDLNRLIEKEEVVLEIVQSS